MTNSPHNMLSRKGKVALEVLSALTALSLFYFYFLAQGPMYWVAGWITDHNGRHSLMLAFVLSFLPIIMVQWMIVLLFDRFASRSKGSI